MLIEIKHDGSLYDETLINSKGFFINPDKDIKKVSTYDSETGEKTDNTEIIFNFVGFVTNGNDDILAVFPKNYPITDCEKDSRIVFECISKHIQKKPDKYIGNEDDIKYESNFPFSSFFKIYEYYQTFGLFFEDEIFIKPNTGGKISWKETISRSDKFVIRGGVVMFPLYYRKKYHFSNFITECMIYAIDYTISKFGFLLDLQTTGRKFPEFDYTEEKKYVIGVLEQLRQQIFKDHILRLIDNLIDFFSSLNVGGKYYIKHYSFSSIWEDMVTNYLCNYFKEVDSSYKIIFDKIKPSGLVFSKHTFHTNKAHPKQYISPDHYNAGNNIQLIFDAKYYTSVRGMNYKQIAYMFMLKDIVDQSTGKPKYPMTFSALILPSNRRETKIHFQLDPAYGNALDMLITEEYLDIKEVMTEYLR